MVTVLYKDLLLKVDLIGAGSTSFRIAFCLWSIIKHIG